MHIMQQAEISLGATKYPYVDDKQKKSELRDYCKKI